MKDKDAEFYALSDRNYAEQAGKLVAEGWEMRRHPDGIIPATFHKQAHGQERILYLVTDFSNPNWWPRVLPGELREVNAK